VPVPVSAGLARAVARHGPGTTFCLARGVHHLLSPVVPKDGDTFRGARGAVLSGAVELRFNQAGSVWVAAAPSLSSGGEGECQREFPQCSQPNDVFWDGRPLRRTSQLAGLKGGSYYVDPTAKTITVARNPRGHKVEESVGQGAFKGWRTGVDDVTIRGLRIEKFANPAGLGAINARPSWRVIGNTIRLNHGTGVQDAHVIRGNRIVENGQLGVVVSFGTNVVISNNLIAFNNYAGYDPNWEAGGAKWVRSKHVLVQRNRVVGNRGPGLWSDGDDIYITYANNRITGNTGPGILHEISYNALIRDNVVRRNGSDGGGWVDGAGILLSNSSNVRVEHNVVSRNRDGIGLTQTDRGSGTYGPYEIRNDIVRGNRITMDKGHTGLVQNVGDSSFFTQKGNAFDRNVYYLGCGSAYFAWADPRGHNDYAWVTTKQWQAAGNDRHGRFHISCRKARR
jgi:parallel beta-helix repeat protein